MKHFVYLSITLLTLIAFSSTSVISQTKTTIGNKCYAIIGSSGNGEECISTKSGKICYSITPKTKQIGFGSSPYHSSYETGAQYRVTLKNGLATRGVYTGRVNKSTKKWELE